MTQSRDLVIDVGETEFKQLLDRDRASADAKQLKPWADLLHNIVNYGSNLLPRCFVSSARKLEDVVALGILLRQCVAMLDSAEILLHSGAVQTAQLQISRLLKNSMSTVEGGRIGDGKPSSASYGSFLGHPGAIDFSRFRICRVFQQPVRALFEASVYLEWIMAADSEKKANYYYVHNLRRKKFAASRIEPGSEFMQMMTNLGVPLRPEVVSLAKAQTVETDRILAQPTFAAISQHFDNLRGKRKKDVDWFVPLGLKKLG
jgi:hypothetical protein